MKVRSHYWDPFAAAVVAVAALAPLILPTGLAHLLASLPVPPLFASAAARSRDPGLWHGASALLSYTAALVAPFSVFGLLRTRRAVAPARGLLFTLGVLLLAFVACVLAVQVSPTTQLTRFSFLLTSRPGLVVFLVSFSAFYYVLVYGLLGVIASVAPRVVAAP